jgi:hypothetical protein
MKAAHTNSLENFRIFVGSVMDVLAAKTPRSIEIS